jgi:hypothetical protein
MGSPLWTEVRTSRVEVFPLGDAGLRAAIVRPAEAVGVYVDPASVERLVEHRLLTASGAEEGADRRIDLAHEALITGWPTRRGWLVGPDAADIGFDPALVDLAMASRASIDQARAGHELARLITALSSTGT